MSLEPKREVMWLKSTFLETMCTYTDTAYSSGKGGLEIQGGEKKGEEESVTGWVRKERTEG